MSPPPPHECGAPTAVSSDTSDTSPTACNARAVVNAACDVERAGLDRADDESGACLCAQRDNPATSAGTDIRAITSNNTIIGSNESHTCDIENLQEEEEGKAVGREGYWRTEESRHDNCTTVTDAFEAAIEDCLAHCVVASRPAPPHISSIHCTHRKVDMDGWGACHTSCDLKTTKDTPETLTCRTSEVSCEVITRSSCNVRPTDEHDGKVEEVAKVRVAPITRRSSSRHLDDSTTRRVTGDMFVRTRKGEADLQLGRRRDIGRRCIGKARTRAMRDGKVRRALLRIWPPSLRDTALQHYYRVLKEGEGSDDCTRCDRCYGANVKTAASERVATPSRVSRTVNAASAATPRNEVYDAKGGQGGGATETCAVAELLRGICADKMYLFATSHIIAARDVRQTRSVRQSAKVRRTSTPTCCVHRSSSSSSNDSDSDSSRDKGKGYYNTANAISSSVTEQRDLTRRRPSLTSQSPTDATPTTTFTRGTYVSSNATGSSRGITDSHTAYNANANDDDDVEVKVVRVVAAGHKHGEHSGPVHTSCTSHTCVPLVFRPVHWYTSSSGSRRHTRLDTLSSNDDSDSDGKEIPVDSFRSAAPLRGMTAPSSSAASAAALSMSSSSLLSQGPSAAVRALGWFRSEQERQRMARHIMSSGKLRHECPEVFALLCARAAEARATHPDCDPSQ